MAIVVLINHTTYREGVNAIGDIVGIFEDAHQFSEAETAMFDFVACPNLTAADLTGCLKSPEIRRARCADGVERTVWRNTPDDPWCELVMPVKYCWTTGGINAEEQAFLTGPADREVKIAVLATFGNNCSYQAENRGVVDVVELIDEDEVA